MDSRTLRGWIGGFAALAAFGVAGCNKAPQTAPPNEFAGKYDVIADAPMSSDDAINAILDANNIPHYMVGSTGHKWSVPDTQKDKALKLLEDDSKAKHYEIKLLPNGEPKRGGGGGEGAPGGGGPGGGNPAGGKKGGTTGSADDSGKGGAGKPDNTKKGGSTGSADDSGPNSVGG